MDQQIASVTSLFYCQACRETRFGIAICDCTTCGATNVRCPQFWSKDDAICQFCASKGGLCARCGKPRFKPRAVQRVKHVQSRPRPSNCHHL